MKKHYEEVPTVYLKLAAEKWGVADLGVMVGYSPSSISTFYKTGRCRLTVELACKSLVDRETWVVKPGQHSETLEAIFKSMGVEYTSID